MLENNNLKVCRKLVRREFKFHKVRNCLLLAAILHVMLLYTFVFLIGSNINDATLYSYEMHYGSTNHIIYTGLTKQQADIIKKHDSIKKSETLKTLGRLTNDSLEYRNIQLSEINEKYAETIKALPTVGRMPESPDEIAMEEFTLDSLGVPARVGASVTITWQPLDGQKEVEQEFILSGYWKDNAALYGSSVWVSKEYADSLLKDNMTAQFANITLGVTLHRPDNVEQQAMDILEDSNAVLQESLQYEEEAGLKQVPFTTNLAYNESRQEMVKEKISPYYLILVFILFCGFISIYNIVYISIEVDTRFYGRLKTLGVTPRQIRRMVYEKACILCVVSIPLGGLFGFIIYALLIPKLISGVEHVAVAFLKPWPFLAAMLFCFITVLIACMIPAHYADRVSPAEAMDYVANGKKKRSSCISNNFADLKKTRKRTSLGRMALTSLRRNKGRMALSLISLGAAFVLLCGTWVRWISYDETMYVEAISISDFVILDGSVQNQQQRYNPQSRSITLPFMEALASQAFAKSIGILKSKEVHMNASESVYAQVQAFFRDPYGYDDQTSWFEAMKHMPNWQKAYLQFTDTGEYISVVRGVEGLFLDKAFEESSMIQGDYNDAQFATGKYVIADASLGNDSISNANVGEKVVIEGREFTVMAACTTNNHFVTGANSVESEFSLDYFMPMEVFDELFPDSGIRQVLLDVTQGSETETENFLREYKESHNSNMAFTMKSDIIKEFEESVFGEVIVELLIGIVLFSIGILNFICSLVTATTVRYKEFAVYESLGMTEGQLYRLLGLEGIFQAAMLLCVLFPVVFAAIWFGMPAYYGASQEWAYIYQFSLAPFWISIPALLVVSVGIPWLCLSSIKKESITDRLRLFFFG